MRVVIGELTAVIYFNDGNVFVKARTQVELYKLVREIMACKAAAFSYYPKAG